MSLGGALGGFLSKYITGATVQRLAIPGIAFASGWLANGYIGPSKSTYNLAPGSTLNSGGGNDLLGGLGGILPLVLIFTLLPRMTGSSQSQQPQTIIVREPSPSAIPGYY